MIFMWVHLGPISTRGGKKKKCVRALENTAWHRTGHARFIFQCVGCWKGWREQQQLNSYSYSYRKTNQLSNGIPQCMFIIIIIFIVPCLTIIHGYKQSFSICFSSCVGMWVCVWFNVFIISLSRTNSRHPRILVFVFPLLPCLHEWLSNFLYEFLSFIFFSTLTSFNKPSFLFWSSQSTSLS